MNTTTESEKNASATEAPQPKTKRTPVKKAKPPKKPSRAKKPASKPTDERSNKKADVIALMKRAKGATLAEIMAVTKWQAHTVRGFVSILGGKGGEKIESSKNTSGERVYKIAKQTCQQPFVQTPPAVYQPGGDRFPACVGHIAHPVSE